ncbi:MAG: hypothetical protein WC534_01430 [Candidatus Paceibacterota bacterium]
MDILQDSKKSEMQKTKPIFLILLLLLLIGFGVYWYTKNNSSSLAPILTPTESSTQSFPSINIDFEFLKAENFLNLEAFPDYPAFRPSTGLEVIPGRVNPFLPPSTQK